LNGDSLTLKVISGSQEFTLPYTKNPDLGFDGTYTASNYKLGIVGKGFLFYENNQCIGSGILKKNSNTAIDITILATKQGDPDLFVGTGTFSGTGSGSTLTLTGSGSLGSGPFTLTKQ
ncbi:MAG: hypothetical protein LBQ44_09040, partial [Treponema sp.]|nr:hypothetical protein [Treponema sp.]